MRLCEIWKEQCDAARQIEAEFGTEKALDYLIGEKFLSFLEAAENDAEFRAEVLAFVAEIKTIFEPWKLVEHLETARQSEPFDPDDYEDEDPEMVELDRQCEISRSASDLLLVEGAREFSWKAISFSPVHPRVIRASGSSLQESPFAGRFEPPSGDRE